MSAKPDSREMSDQRKVLNNHSKPEESESLAKASIDLLMDWLEKEENYSALKQRVRPFVENIHLPDKYLDEVIQDVCVDILLGKCKFNPQRGSPLPYLSKVARNIAIETLEKHIKAHDINMNQNDFYAVLGTPFDEAHGRQNVEDYEECLEAIERSTTPDEKMVLLMRAKESITYESIAKHKNISEDYARKLYSRGLGKCRKYLDCKRES